MAFLTAETIGRFIPSYLAPESKEEMLAELSKENIANIDYYTSGGPDQALQGDGISGFEWRDPGRERSKSVRGIVLSNSCDIDPANDAGDGDRHLVFAPLVELQTLLVSYKQAQFSDSRIAGVFGDFRSQRSTDTFYLPAAPGLGESIAIFDRLQVVRLQSFLEAEKRQLFRLSNAGFYLFVVKLSLHFCRLWERLDRSGVSGVVSV